MTKAIQTVITVRKFYDHAIVGHGYMSGIKRDDDRVSQTGEIFTPNDLVLDVLAGIIRKNKGSIIGRDRGVLDPTCGDGQFLIHSLLLKLLDGDLSKMQDPHFMDLDITKHYKFHLKRIFGCDIMPDNVLITRKRLSVGFMGDETIRTTLRRQIRCKDSAKYDFEFAPRKSNDGEV